MNNKIIISALIIFLTSLVLMSLQKETVNNLNMTTISGEKITSKDKT